MEQTRVTLANGIELDTVDVGPRDAPALIFLHGFPENHRTWRHQIAHFSENYRCIAPDQRGYRGSSRPEAVEDYTPDKLIGDVFALADALDVQDFTIVGHDWGGAIAWGTAYWGQASGRVKRCIIANAPHPVTFGKLLHTSRTQRAASQYMRAFRDTSWDERTRREGLLPLLTEVTQWQAHERMEPPEREQLLDDWSDGDAAIAMLNWYRATPLDVPPLDAPYDLPADYAPPPLPQLSIPTLVVWGMDDLALPPENMDGLEAIIDDLTVERIEGAGHFVPWEAPDAVIGAMERFLERPA